MKCGVFEERWGDVEWMQSSMVVLKKEGLGRK